MAGKFFSFRLTFSAAHFSNLPMLVSAMSPLSSVSTHHFFIFARLHQSISTLQTASDVTTHLFSLPTLTVAIIFISGPQGSDRAKHVSSKNDECSEYGTPINTYQPPHQATKGDWHPPYIMNWRQLPLMGFKLASVKTRDWSRRITMLMSGNVSVPAGGLYDQPVGRNPMIRSKWGCKRAR